MTPSHAENTKRIAKNTLMLYVRMLFGMLVSLYTSRVVLNALGVEDYGIYNVVGGFVAMFSIISSSLSASVSRFLTFELGRGDMQRLKEIFSTSVLIHIALAVIVLILAESVGVWFLNTHMTIPAERFTAANWVFQASIVSFMFGLFSVPYNASIVSHERMSAFAYIGILDIILRLLIVLFIAYAPFHFDRLIVYSLLLVGVGTSLQCVYWTYCRKNFEECRQVRVFFNKTCWKEISAFAGWNFIGSASTLVNNHGINILLNIFYGVVVNASRGIAVIVNNAIGAFVGNFATAIRPQLTKSYAVGDKGYMFSLAERGARFSFYIILFLALPVALETDFILMLWLTQIPEHTINFVRLLLLLSLCDVFSGTLVTIQLATGNIRNYQIVVGGTQFLIFPLSYICFKYGSSPESTYIISIFISLLCLILRLFFLHRMVGLSIKKYLRDVCGNAILVMVLAAVIPILVHNNMSYGWWRFLVVTFISVICVLISTYFVGCSVVEQQFVKEKFRSIRNKLFD